MHYAVLNVNFNSKLVYFEATCESIIWAYNEDKTGLYAGFLPQKAEISG